MKKLAIITTHPIQYNAPFFRLLSERGKVYPKVFYTWPQALERFVDKDFGKVVQWDIPLLDGYEWEAVENISPEPTSKNWGGIDCPSLIKKLSDFHPDAILIYGWNLKSHFKTMRYFKGKTPVWFFGDSTLLDEVPGMRKLARRLWLRWVYRHIDKAFYVGTNNKSYFLAHGVKENQLVFFPHAVDNDRFFDNPDNNYEMKAKKWRRKLGFSEDDFVVLYAGKFETIKNVELLLDATKSLNTQNNGEKINLLLVGNGPKDRILSEKAETDKNIKFLPFQNQSVMPLVYRLGDVFCLPSLSETWGLAVNEAMACSRAVVVSDRVGCARDLITPGKNGYIFRQGSLEQLVEILKSMLTAKGRLKDMGLESKRIIDKWSYKIKCESLENQLISLQHN